MSERVHQAEPSTCVRVARDRLTEAAGHLQEGGDWGAALEAINSARAWLPSWLEREWDDHMADWIARSNGPRETVRKPHPNTMIGRR